MQAGNLRSRKFRQAFRCKLQRVPQTDLNVFCFNCVDERYMLPYTVLVQLTSFDLLFTHAYLTRTLMCARPRRKSGRKMQL